MPTYEFTKTKVPFNENQFYCEKYFFCSLSMVVLIYEC